jgi:acetyl-CoA/propionyl-CoA carboxylase biotin carboxyl carrier protein
VNTRLQVEHPVTEEVAGIDLVREQFRIAQGEKLGYSDPELRGHSIEFRINGEDPGRGFLPAPGTLTLWNPPSGPGVRLDGGFVQGDVIGGNFDSLLAKLIVTGRDRAEALQRSRRALAEFEVDGIATAIPFHRAVVSDAAFAPADPATPFSVHTRWIETEFDNTIPAYSGGSDSDSEAGARSPITVEVNGKRVEVVLPANLSVSTSGGSAAGAANKPGKRAKKAAGGASGDAVAAPMQGTIVKIAVAEGQEVAAGELVIVLEAMKMEQPLTAHKAGVVTGLSAEVGATVSSGTVLLEIK